MGICCDKAMPRKVFAAVGHTRLQKTLHDAARQRGCHCRIAVKGTIPNHAAGTKVQIQDGGKGEIYATCA